MSRADKLEVLRDENTLLLSKLKKLEHQLARQQQAFRALIDIEKITLRIDNEFNLGTLLHELLELVLHTCNADNGSLVLVDEGARKLEFVEVIGPARDALLNHRIDFETGIVGSVIQTGTPVVVDTEQLNYRLPAVEEYPGFLNQSLMCVALKTAHQIIGAIELVTSPGDRLFDDNDLNILSVACCYVARALERTETLLVSVGEE